MNITCDHCESEIDVANDKNCVVYDPSGITAVICEACRKRMLDQSTYGDINEWLREGYRITRGWRA